MDGILRKKVREFLKRTDVFTDTVPIVLRECLEMNLHEFDLHTAEGDNRRILSAMRFGQAKFLCHFSPNRLVLAATPE